MSAGSFQHNSTLLPALGVCLFCCTKQPPAAAGAAAQHTRITTQQRLPVGHAKTGMHARLQPILITTALHLIKPNRALGSTLPKARVGHCRAGVAQAQLRRGGWAGNGHLAVTHSRDKAGKGGANIPVVLMQSYESGMPVLCSASAPQELSSAHLFAYDRRCCVREAVAAHRAESAVVQHFKAT